MKKFTAKAKRQQVKKAKKGDGSWTKPQRISVESDRGADSPSHHDLRGIADSTEG